MHELSIAQSIVDVVNRNIPSELSGSVRRIRIAVGEHSGVVAESLLFCFEMVVSETPLEAARLVMERIPVRSQCLQCRREFENGEMKACCPFCHGKKLALVAGTELQVLEVEVEE